MSAGESEQDLLQSISERSSESDASALSGIIALSERASHPVSKAVASMAKRCSSHLSKLPNTDLQKFQLVPGKIH